MLTSSFFSPLILLLKSLTKGVRWKHLPDICHLACAGVQRFMMTSGICAALCTEKISKSSRTKYFLWVQEISSTGHMHFSAWEHSGEDKHKAFGLYLENRLSTGTILNGYHPLGSMTTMGVGGNARWYAEPANAEDLRSLVEACKLFELPRSMMGRWIEFNCT